MTQANIKIKFFSHGNYPQHEAKILKNNPSFKYDPKNFEMIIVLGGDGSFLDAVKKYYHLPVKICLFHIGKLGFFQGDFENYKYQHKSHYQPYKLLELIADGNQYLAFNDILIMSNGSTIDYKVKINHKILYNFYASGFLVNTAYGSTGLNRSMGGPLFDNSDLYCFQEVFSNRYPKYNQPLGQPLLLNKNDHLLVKIKSSHNNLLHLKVDGVEYSSNANLFTYGLIDSNASINWDHLLWLRKVKELLIG